MRCTLAPFVLFSDTIAQFIGATSHAP